MLDIDFCPMKCHNLLLYSILYPANWFMLFFIGEVAHAICVSSFFANALPEFDWASWFLELWSWCYFRRWAVAETEGWKEDFAHILCSGYPASEVFWQVIEYLLFNCYQVEVAMNTLHVIFLCRLMPDILNCALKIVRYTENISVIFLFLFSFFLSRFINDNCYAIGSLNSSKY